VDLERLVEQPPDLPARVERCAGILVHVLKMPGDCSPLAPSQPADLPSPEADLARRRAVDAHHRLAERRLAASALADEAERLARPHRERHAVHRPDRARAKAERVPDREMPREVHHLEQRRRARLAHAALSG
jgi:hypothetical protein